MVHKFHRGRAIVVGVANYRKLKPLPEVVLNDAKDLAELLQSTSHCGYAPENVHLLLDGEATAEAIRRALRDLSLAASSDDTILFFFSGHGGRVEDGARRGTYLLPVDCDPDDLSRTAIESTEFTSLLRAIASQRLAVLLDACHAGGAGELKRVEPLKELKTGFTEQDFSRLGSGAGRVMLASSRSDEVSCVLHGMKNSLFTYYLLKGLRGAGQTRDDGLVRIFDIFHYVAENVKTKAPQHPVLKANDVQDNFPLALYQRNQKDASSQSSVITPSDDDSWWELFESTAAQLYPQGPMDAEIWSRAGGDAARLRLNLAGRAAWHSALHQLRQGGGGAAISVRSLLASMFEEYPRHAGLAQLRQP